VSDQVKIARREGLIEAEVDGELVALHVENGTCYGFNGTATRVWSLLAEPMTLDELCGALTAEFDVDAETCRADVSELLRELESDGLIDIEGALPATGA
jgi:DNA-binding transcriptional regulator GbsR (MarR family)